MLCIYHRNSNPYFNIASEEHLLKRFTDDIFMLYINSPSVIVGKHQNTMAEVDYHFALENDIKIVRRLSGGGAVYHDHGNLNFCFIRNGKEGALVDFKGFTKPIIEILGKLGVEAKFEGHNSLTINGLKFSGNAEHIFKQRVMHHGTLLFSSDLQALANVLYVSIDKYSDRAVKSVRANTANITEFLNQQLSIYEFADFIMNHMLASYNDAVLYQFSSEDIDSINQLVKNKYTSWDWNFGYSPNYFFSREITIDDRLLKAEINVEKGMVSSLELLGDAINKDSKEQIINALTGIRHSPDEMKKELEKSKITETLVTSLLQILF